jgi:epoxyqueuosine reductase
VEKYYKVIPQAELLELVRNTGFHRCRFLNTRDAPQDALPDGSLVLCALSCYTDEADDQSQPGDPHGLIAPFARRNYYRECVVRLQTALREISKRTGLKKRESRIFCNSQLPEKQLAAQAGLGFYGKNSLIIAPSQGSLPNLGSLPSLGSLFVIAGLFLPFEYQSDSPLSESPGEFCGSCQACIEACPVGALSEKGELDREACLQSISTSRRSYPHELKEIWGTRLYGCQICQDVCPFNRDLTTTCYPKRGELGPSVPLRAFLEPSEEQLRLSLKRTTLGQSWIQVEALKRNALVAAGNHQDPAVLPYIRPYLQSAVSFIREAASWARERISEKRAFQFDK